MSKKVKFALNTGYGGGIDVIRVMARPAVIKAAERVAERATRISEAMSDDPNTFSVTEMGIGIPNKYGGRRIYAKITAQKARYSYDSRLNDKHSMDNQALHLALDAGRMTRLGG